MNLEEALKELPLVAIIRGVMPEQAPAIGDALYAEGFRIVEVPLNSPQPFDSIRALAKAFEGRMVVGGGTVLNVEDARRVAEAGGRIVVSPNVNRDVIRTTLSLGLSSLPGFITPTEAFTAASAGATALKLFPASSVGPAHLKAVKEVLPPEVKIYPVGGVGPESFKEWVDVGAAGFGLGGGLYVAGRSPQETASRARAYVSAWRALRREAA
ncbi:MAG: 2-dehydro-3-deoxy-6-phosphogalactonate aldolase [Caulobacteraceae bacterium]